MTEPIAITVSKLHAICKKLMERQLGDNVLSAKSGNVELVITDVVSCPAENSLVFEVAQVVNEPKVLKGPIEKLMDGPDMQPNGESFTIPYLPEDTK